LTACWADCGYFSPGLRSLFAGSAPALRQVFTCPSPALYPPSIGSVTVLHAFLCLLCAYSLTHLLYGCPPRALAGRWLCGGCWHQGL